VEVGLAMFFSSYAQVEAKTHAQTHAAGYSGLVKVKPSRRTEWLPRPFKGVNKE
jgi:hypothetical protein